MKSNNVLAFDLSTEGLEPLKHRIIGITIKTANEETIISYRNEEEILKHFWTYIEQGNFDKLIGFNSLSLDIPMLLIRSIKHKVKIANSFLEKHIDLRAIIVSKSDMRRGTLDNFRELLDIEFPISNYRKMHMSLLWENTNINSLNKFLLRDVIIIWNLFENMQEANLL